MRFQMIGWGILKEKDLVDRLPHPMISYGSI